MREEVKPEDVIVDDGALLADRLVRSLHRNKDGHLAVTHRQHENSVDESHNVAVLYIYTGSESDGYEMHEHYVFSHERCNYKAWSQIVKEEIALILSKAKRNFHSIYGWTTAHIKVTPLRTGDLFIKVDKEGARGVRLTFNSRKSNGKAQRK